MIRSTSTLSTLRGSKLRDIGIHTALDNADSVHDKWSDTAYIFLLKYIKSHREFMTEDVRVASEKEIPIPPSKRAWGGITVRAVKAGLIERIGFSNVKNIKAHRTPATVWRVID